VSPNVPVPAGGGDRPVVPSAMPVPAALPPVADLVIARAVHAAVSAVPGVCGLFAGRVAELATYGPGETVRGVVVRHVGGDLMVAVHVVAAYRAALVFPTLADQIRAGVGEAISALGDVPVRRIDVSFDDLRVASTVPGAGEVQP
jgi:uncharacterized alkaline shock family protein YloU